VQAPSCFCEDKKREKLGGGTIRLVILCGVACGVVLLHRRPASLRSFHAHSSRSKARSQYLTQCAPRPPLVASGDYYVQECKRDASELVSLLLEIKKDSYHFCHITPLSKWPADVITLIGANNWSNIFIQPMLQNVTEVDAAPSGLMVGRLLQKPAQGSLWLMGCSEVWAATSRHGHQQKPCQLHGKCCYAKPSNYVGNGQASPSKTAVRFCNLYRARHLTSRSSQGPSKVRLTLDQWS
jgi:hypothetical protein